MEENFKNTFGLVITDNDLTAIELAYQKGRVKVVNYSRIELKPDVVTEDCIVANAEEFKNSLAKLIIEAANGPIRSRNVIISIPEEKAFFHYLNIPKDCSGDLDFVREVARDFIPIELEDTISDYKVLRGSPGDKMMKLSFVAIQKNIVEPLIKLLNDVGLNVVAVDTSKDTLIRFCENPLNRNGCDFMIVDVAMSTIFLCSMNTYGISHSVNAKISGKNCLDKIKEKLGVGSFLEVKEILKNLKEIPNPEQDGKYQAIKANLQGYYDTVIEKSLELTRIMKNENNFKLGRIYTVGCLSCLPGLKEKFKEKYPQVEITDKLDYVEFDEKMDPFYHHAIGLALRAALPKTNEDEINLLPEHVKEKLNLKRLTPVIIKPLVGIFAMFAVALVFSGIFGVSKYVEYRVSENEKNIILEQIENPYLKEAAKSTEQKTQLEKQITKILGESVPTGILMEKIDSYNSNGINLINTSFSISKENKPMILIRGKASSRGDTENFVALLEGDPFYSQINSPLSNLVGQGERFINIELTLDMEEIIKAEKNSGPSLPEKENTDNNN